MILHPHCDPHDDPQAAPQCAPSCAPLYAPHRGSRGQRSHQSSHVPGQLSMRRRTPNETVMRNHDCKEEDQHVREYRRCSKRDLHTGFVRRSNQRRHPRNHAHWPCLLGPQLGQGQTFCQLLAAWTEQGFVSVQRAEPGGFQHTQELATGLCNLHFGVRVSTIGTATATTR